MDTAPLVADGPELLPGLPNDLALLCLARIPALRQRVCLRVCWAWSRAFSSGDIQQVRAREGLQADLMCMCHLASATPGTAPLGKPPSRLVARAYCHVSATWAALPSLDLPEGAQPLQNFRFLSTGRELFFIGEFYENDTNFPSRVVRSLRPQAAGWRHEPAFRVAKKIFAAGVRHGKVHIYGWSSTNDYHMLGGAWLIEEVMDLRASPRAWRQTSIDKFEDLPSPLLKAVSKNSRLSWTGRINNLLATQEPFAARLVGCRPPDFFAERGQPFVMAAGRVYGLHCVLRRDGRQSYRILRLCPAGSGAGCGTAGGRWEEVAALPARFQRLQDEGCFLATAGVGRLAVVMTGVVDALGDRGFWNWLRRPADGEESKQMLSYMSVFDLDAVPPDGDAAPGAWEVLQRRVNLGPAATVQGCVNLLL